MGGTRFMTLLTTPFPPLLRSSLIVLHRSLSTTTLRPLTIFSPSTTAKPHTPPQRAAATSFHSQPNNKINNSTYALNSSPPEHHHPWPEWTHFLNILSSNGPPVDHRIPPEDAFVVYEELPDDFVRASAACLAFARARPDLLGLLSRRDIEAVVSNGTPFLFKSALDAARRMRAFLGTDGTNASGVDKANTTDLMKYILSYASNASASSERNGLYSRELVDSSIRNLLRELGTVSSGVPPSYVPASSHQLTGGYRQTPKPFGQNIEMKRGDWICAKCNFMNFARNTKCLECEQSRPKKQLTGGEWECPQCNFYNYGRNSACLRCDCRRPGAPLFNSMPGSRYNIDNSNITNTDNRAPGNEERAQSWFNKISQLNNSTNINKSAPSQDLPESKPLTSDIENKEKEEAEKSERWFKKVAELHDVKDLASAVSDDDFPETMPMPKGEYRFVVSKNKDRSLTSPKYKRQAAMDQANNTNFVPFVPFPPGYFAKKDPEQTEGQDSPSNSVSESKVTTETEKLDDTSSSKTVPETTNNSRVDNNESVGSSWTGKSLEGSAVKETDPLDMSEEAKAERWFKRVAQIKDISELSQIPDEDFPSIMPMRKGVNRFVVSKRKTPLERRLTSQQYRRNLPIVSNEPLKKETDNS